MHRLWKQFDVTLFLYHEKKKKKEWDPTSIFFIYFLIYIVPVFSVSPSCINLRTCWEFVEVSKEEDGEMTCFQSCVCVWRQGKWLEEVEHGEATDLVLQMSTQKAQQTEAETAEKATGQW